MRNLKTVILFFVFCSFAFIFLQPAVTLAENTCHGGAGGSLTDGTHFGSSPEYYGIGKNVDSSYPNDLDCAHSSTYICPSGSTTKIYINYDLEARPSDPSNPYDYVEVMNGAGNLLAKFPDTADDSSGGYVWKGPFSSNTLRFGAHSDHSITHTGFDIWGINCISPDNTAPTLAQVTAVPSPTNDTTPNYTFSSTEAGAIAYAGDCSSATTAASSGNNTVTFNALAAGSHTNCTIKVTDAAGNLSTALAVNAFTIDTTAPTLAQVTAVPSPTNDTTPNYTFSSTEAGAIAYAGDCSSATTAASSGNNTVTFNALAAGSHTNCTIKVTDAAGNLSTALAVNSFTIDITAPVITSTAPATNASIKSQKVSYTLSEAVVYSSYILFTRTSGAADSGSPHTCSIQGTALNTGAHTDLVLATNADACANWANPLVNGTVYTVEFKVFDPAGNPSVTVSNTSVTYDTTAPTISALVPADNATGIVGSADMYITFNEAVNAGSGNIVIHKASDDSAVETIAANSFKVTGVGTATIKINPDTSLANNASFYIKIANTAFADLAGNPFAGITDKTTWNFATVDTTAPTPGNSGTITTASVAQTSLTLNWTKATDNVSTQANIQYEVRKSSSNNIGTVANAEANGFVIKAYTADIATFGVTGLTAGTTYYFNVITKDEAGNKAIYTTKSETTAAPPSLTFPSNTWQRLWYNDPKNNDFSVASYLGDGPGSNDKNGTPPDVTSVSFNTDWAGGILAYGRSETLGFRSSRTINFSPAGNYRFTVGSDDGVRLYVSDENDVLQLQSGCTHWANRGYQTQFCDLALSAGNHRIELDFYENTDNARVSFAYGPSPCAKTDIIPTSNISVTVKTAVGAETKQCPVRLSHFGKDATDANTDGGAVKYEVISQQAGEITIGMDDAPVGQGNCNNDIVWKTEWQDPVGARNLRVHTSIRGYDTGHDLFYAYQVLTDVPQRSCVIDANVSQQPCDGNFCVTNIQTPIASASSWWIGTVQAAAQCFTQNYCPGHTSLGDRYAVVTGNYGSDQSELRATGWMYDYNVVECTANAHCTPGDPNANSDANANKQICNIGVTTNFSQNTCIDSVPPTSKIIKVEDDYIPAHSPGFAQNIPPITGAHSAFLNADNNGNVKKLWYVLVEDIDNSGGSDLDSCFISINGFTLPRVCNDWTSPISVGRSSAGAIHCTEEGNDKCKIKVWAQDKAGNKNDAALLERKVYEATASPPRLDERKYNDFTAYPDGFNVFWLGVDWTAPTAQ